MKNEKNKRIMIQVMLKVFKGHGLHLQMKLLFHVRQRYYHTLLLYLTFYIHHFNFRKSKKKSMNIQLKERKSDDEILTIKMLLHLLVILNQQHSIKNQKIHHHQHYILKILMIIKVDRFFTYHKMLVLIYVQNMDHKDALFQNNVYIHTKDIQKQYKKSTIFLFRLIYFLLVQWIAKSKYILFLQKALNS